MKPYDYETAVEADVRNYIDDHFDGLKEMEFDTVEALADYLLDELWDDEAVTGGEYGYFSHPEEAVYSLKGNEALLDVAVGELGYNIDDIDQMSHAKRDTIIRQWTLKDWALGIVMERMGGLIVKEMCIC